MNKVIKLNYINEIERKIASNNDLIQVLIGPRQVGKTTSILELMKIKYQDEHLYFSADKVFNSSPQWLVEIWNQALIAKKIIVIDEIQKCENWSETLKTLYDESKRKKQSIRCIVLGSSSLELSKGLTESLTGRFQLTHAFHWNFEESNKGYGINFENYLKFGGYPGSYPLIHNQKDWIDFLRNSIINTVIEKDILQYRTVKSPALFRQAFEILNSYPAQEISYTKLLGQLQDHGNVEIIKYYLQLFEGAFLIKTLEKYSSKIIKAKSSSPKILPLCPSMYYLTLLDTYRPDERGRVFELLVGTQLLRTGERLYYWREGRHEVDYILAKGRKVWAIEVKTGDSKKKHGLLEFKKKYPQAILVFINENNYFEFEKNPITYLESIDPTQLPDKN